MATGPGLSCILNSLGRFGTKASVPVIGNQARQSAAVHNSLMSPGLGYPSRGLRHYRAEPKPLVALSPDPRTQGLLFLIHVEWRWVTFLGTGANIYSPQVGYRQQIKDFTQVQLR